MPAKVTAKYPFITRHTKDPRVVRSLVIVGKVSTDKSVQNFSRFRVVLITFGTGEFYA